MITESPAAVLAAMIAEGLGWPEGDHRERPEWILYRDPNVRFRPCIEASSTYVWIYGPSSEHLFAFVFRWRDGVVRVTPANPEVYARSDDNRDFFRHVDALSDGMITLGLTNANETSCLDWLQGSEDDD